MTTDENIKSVIAFCQGLLGDDCKIETDRKIDTVTIYFKDEVKEDAVIT